MSTIIPLVTKSCPEGIKKLRIKEASKVDDNFILTEDILFSSLSTAAGFVSQSSANGLVEWKTENGITLKNIE